jgi:hypothetical protein
MPLIEPASHFSKKKPPSKGLHFNWPQTPAYPEPPLTLSSEYLRKNLIEATTRTGLHKDGCSCDLERLRTDTAVSDQIPVEPFLGR